MGWVDLLRLSWGAVAAHRLRSALTMLGILIGIASVILLTSIGEGTRRYILSEFTQFGTNLLGINPGKAMTTGQPGALAGTFRKLTLDDMDAIARIPGVEHIVPLVFGTARVEAGERGRSVFIYGVSSKVPDVWKFRIGQGRFLPEVDPRRGGAFAVLGPTLKRELFGEENALGKHVRIGGQRFLVIGVMEPKGQFLGIDIDDSAYIPVGSAQEIFDQDGLWEIDLTFVPLMEDAVIEGVRRVLIERHGGEEDFTITAQSDALAVMDRVLGVVSLAVGAIGAISLVVGAIGILTMMWISVNERTAEIGLAKAIGASSVQILAMHLSEAALLSLAGGALGLAAGLGIATVLRWLIPGLPVHTPLRYVFLALAVSLLVGLASGALPALRASRLEPVQALRAE